MTTEEMLIEINKKLDRLLTRSVKIAKVLHLVPVTPEEEKNIQILQRKNLNIASKVNDELDVMQNKTSEGTPSLGIENILNENQSEIYADIIGDDYLTPTKKGD